MNRGEEALGGRSNLRGSVRFNCGAPHICPSLLLESFGREATMGNGVEFRIMPSDDEGNWYWEVIKNGHEVVARGVADTEPAACEEANKAARKAKLIE
jgi:hypothetical protein